MIPRRAIRAFLQKPRDDLRKYKRMSDAALRRAAAELPARPPIWKKLQRDQRVLLIAAARVRRLAAWADTGCVAGDTLLEVAEGPIRIDELERRGAPVKVWSRTQDGLRLVDAICPFKLGPAPLYEILFASGKKMVVTARHRFLTLRGWVACGDLVVGEWLPGFDVSHLRSSLVPSLSGFLQDVRHYESKGADWCKDFLASEFLSSMDTVVSITYKRTDFYYDLHVPAHENYIAHGLCHHNTGKTLFSMALARYSRAAGVARRFLVLVPGNINLAEWEAERDLHCPRTSMAVLSGSSRRKWEMLRGGAPLLTVATYGGLVRMACDKFVKRGKKWVPVANSMIKAGEVVRLRPVPRKVAELARTFDGLVMDESSADQAVQYKSSLAWRICRKLGEPADHPVVALSGTPFGRDPTPLWAQMYLVDRGDSLGPTLGLFRAAFFKTETNYWGGEEHTFREDMSGELHRLLAHRSITIEADEASLPPVVARTMRIALPRDAEDYAIMARDQILAARGNYQETKNAFLRMRQISSGFLGYTDDETGKRAKFTFDECPKLESLIARLQSVVGKYKAVVFHEFIYSGDRICAELDRLGVGHARAGAGTKKAIKEERERFVRDPACRVFVISNRMAQGPNLQIAKYVEFFESPVDPKTRKQARRRVERQHSQHSKVFITDYVVRGTYDGRILKYLEQGKNLFAEIILGKQS